MPYGKPDTNCEECGGTGQIILFTSSRICECVNRKLNLIKNNNEYDYGKYMLAPKIIKFFYDDSILRKENKK